MKAGQVGRKGHKCILMETSREGGHVLNSQRAVWWPIYSARLTSLVGWRVSWDLSETYALLLMIEKLPAQLVMDGCRQDPKHCGQCD